MNVLPSAASTNTRTPLNLTPRSARGAQPATACPACACVLLDEQPEVLPWKAPMSIDRWTLEASILVPQPESSGAGYAATKCCMKVSMTSTSSAMSPVNGVRSQRPL